MNRRKWDREIWGPTSDFIRLHKAFVCHPVNKEDGKNFNFEKKGPKVHVYGREFSW